MRLIDADDLSNISVDCDSHGRLVRINAPTVCDIEQIRAEIGRVLMDLGTNNAYDMPSFWANNGKDYKVIPTQWHKGYGQAIVDIDSRLKEIFGKYTKGD